MAKGTKDDPWDLETPPKTSKYEMYLEDEVKEAAGKEKPHPARIVCVVGSTVLYYDQSAIDDTVKMLKSHKEDDGWMELGSADEQKPAKPGTVEEWARTKGPNDGWYGLKKGLRGRFAMYMPPLLETLGLVELEHNPKGNRMRAK